jgi:predicted nucleic-acid-binding protein
MIGLDTNVLIRYLTQDDKKIGYQSEQTHRQ